MTKPTLPETFQKFMLAALKRDARIDGSPKFAANRAFETAQAALDLFTKYLASQCDPSCTADPDSWQWQERDGSVHAHVVEQGRYKLVVTQAMNDLWIAQAILPEEGDVLLDEAGYHSAVEAKAACVTAAVLHARGQLWRFSNLKGKL